ncbi:MAG TPA: LysR family transcriptional regulator [Burkholderiales bacterium]
MESAYVYFGEVARLGSIRQAAERLYISASSISRQIAKLEREFDAPLLIRRPQGVELTPAGRVLYEFIQTRSREIERLKAFIDDLKNLRRGHVSLRIVEGLLGGFLPKALAEFAARYPAITYEVKVVATDDVMLAVAEGRCDIGISFHPYPRANVKAVAEVREPLFVVMAPDHPLANRVSLRLADLESEPVSLPDKTFGIRHLIDHAVKIGPIRLNIRCETNSIEMLRRFALTGMGVSFLPGYSFEHEAAAGKLVGVRLTDPGLLTTVTQFCRHAEIELTPAARALMDALIEASGAVVLR